MERTTETFSHWYDRLADLFYRRTDQDLKSMADTPQTDPWALPVEVEDAADELVSRWQDDPFSFM